LVLLRGEATPDSDIDLRVVREGEVSAGREIDRLIDIIFALNSKHNVLLSVYAISENEYPHFQSPLVLNVRREGVPV